MPMLYRVAFDSADDTDVDDETTLLEDHPRPLDVIVEACVKHRIRARIAVDGKMIGAKPTQILDQIGAGIGPRFGWDS